MPKYLFEARYTAEGAIGLAKEGGASRRDAVKKHLDERRRQAGIRCISRSATSIAFVIVDLPDNVSAAALSLAVNESGADRDQGDRAVDAGGDGPSGQEKGRISARPAMKAPA